MSEALKPCPFCGGKNLKSEGELPTYQTLSLAEWEEWDGQ